MAQEHQDKVASLTQAHSTEVEALAAEHQREWKEAKDKAMQVAETRVKALRRAFKEQVGCWRFESTLPVYRPRSKQIRAADSDSLQPANSFAGLDPLRAWHRDYACRTLPSPVFGSGSALLPH